MDHLHPSSPPPSARRRRWATSAGGLALGLALAGAPLAVAGAAPAPQVLAPGHLHADRATGLQLAPGLRAHAQLAPGVSDPDDISGLMGGEYYVAYQNGVGTMGQASPTGATTSTIVAYRQDGTVAATWSVTGKCDGLKVDPANDRVILTVNEDGNSSMDVLHPTAAPGAQVVHLTYNVDPTTLGGGGTDDVAVDAAGNVYVAGSNPSAADAPAVYRVGIDETAGTATLTSLFADDAPATGPGGPTTLALTDPDSLYLMPPGTERFAGDLVLDSQGDSQLIDIHDPGTPGQTLTQLPVGTQVDGFTVATATTGTLVVTDLTTGKLTTITGSFTPGTAYITAPSDSGVAGFVGTVDLTTGTITPVATGFSDPSGILFIPGPPALGPYGYRMTASDGGIFSFGDSPYLGSMGGTPLVQPVVGMASTPDRAGYWEVAKDGGIFSFGDAVYYGSKGGQVLSAPITAMAATPDGGGYWEVGSDGSVYPFGDAVNFGSSTASASAPVVGIAPTADGKGYWLVTSTGQVSAFGNAEPLGSVSGALNKPIVAIAATSDGAGYWLVASDGGIFDYGAAPYEGSAGSLVLNKPITAIVPTNDDEGYWLVATDGGVFSYGDATFYGSMGATALNAPVVGAGS